MDKTNYEYLKSAQLDPCKPQFTQDTMFSVARILINEGVLYNTWDVLSFCERPDKWIGDVKQLLKKYEENK
jgi:hypothetical protein